MVGSWRINAWISALGAALTAAVNISRNPLLTASWRILAAASIFWAIGYALRLLLVQTLPKPPEAEQPKDAGAVGQHLDLSADGGEDLGELLRGELQPQEARPLQSRPEDDFQPLQAPRLKSVPSGMEAEELALAVREISREEG